MFKKCSSRGIFTPCMCTSYARRMMVNDVAVGNKHPIRILTMTATDIKDVAGTVEQVQDCYELSAEYERKYMPEKLEEPENMLTGLDAGDSIVTAKVSTYLIDLANLAEEVQIYRRKIKLF